MLTRALFLVAFTASLDSIREASAITSREIRPLSRQLLAAIHGVDSDQLLTGDRQFINQLLPVLTVPMRKFAISFFKEFIGYHFDEKLGEFTKKDGKRYPDALKAARAFLADPNNNLLTWARDQDVAPKPWSLAKVTTFIDGALKKAIENDIPRLEVLRAAMNGGFTPVEIMAVIKMMADDAAAREELAKQA